MQQRHEGCECMGNDYLQELQQLEWQNFYYGHLHSWLPLSMLPCFDHEKRLPEMRFIIECTNDKELLEASILKCVSLSDYPASKEYIKFYLEIACYMMDKEMDFETAIKRTLKLKSFKKMLYRKSVVEKVVKNAIRLYLNSKENLEVVRQAYHAELDKQVQELKNIVEQLLHGKEQLNVSSDLMNTLLYKQLLSYNVSKDKLLAPTVDSAAIKEIQQAQEYILSNEQKVWGEFK